jgi:hypothetical protein
VKARIASFTYRGLNKGLLILELQGDFREQFDRLKDKDVDVEVKAFKEKRSLTSNAYLWALLDKIAGAVGSDKESIYLDFVRQYGLFKDFTLTEDEAKTFSVAWGKLGTGWPTEQVDYAPDGEHVVIRAYYGSSTYNTKQMSRLLEAVVEECKGLGIETRPKEEIDSLLMGETK